MRDMNSISEISSISSTWTNALYTMREAYRDICVGEETPWVPIGNFTNDFFDYHTSSRADLITASIELPIDATLEQQRWAAFCAASVEYLCEKYQLACPDWVHAPKFGRLDAPWFFSPAAAYNPRVKARFELETPDLFARRNVYCGQRVYLNKKEEADKLRAKLTEKLAQMKQHSA